MSAITKAEKQGLDELFISMSEKHNLIVKLHKARIEVLKFLKILIKYDKINLKRH